MKAQTRSKANLQVFRVPGWQGLDWLLQGFSSRPGGVSYLADSAHPESNLNLGFTGNDTGEAIVRNRCLWLSALSGRDPVDHRIEGLVTLKQMHSAVTRRVSSADISDRASLWGDGLMTAQAGVLLGVLTADCLPVLIVDLRRRVVGAFHAGWRGTLKGIVERGVESIRREYGSSPEELSAAIGPGIGPCCFEVGCEVHDMFSSRYSYAAELFSSHINPRLDLVEANRRQLLSAGIPPEAVFAMKECTSCQTNRFFSYRAERGKTGRMMATIGVIDC